MRMNDCMEKNYISKKDDLYINKKDVNKVKPEYLKHKFTYGDFIRFVGYRYKNIDYFDFKGYLVIPAEKTPQYKPSAKKINHHAKYKVKIQTLIKNASAMELEMIWLPKLMKHYEVRMGIHGMYADDESSCLGYGNIGVQIVNCFHELNGGKHHLNENEVSFLKEHLPHYWKYYAEDMLQNDAKNAKIIKCERCNNEATTLYFMPKNIALCNDCSYNFMTECIEHETMFDYNLTEREQARIDAEFESDILEKEKRQIERKEKEQEESAKRYKENRRKREEKLQKLVDSGKYEICPRCGGTGEYSYCARFGTTCFQCEGNGVVKRYENKNGD